MKSLVSKVLLFLLILAILADILDCQREGRGGGGRRRRRKNNRRRNRNRNRQVVAITEAVLDEIDQLEAGRDEDQVSRIVLRLSQQQDDRRFSGDGSGFAGSVVSLIGPEESSRLPRVSGSRGAECEFPVKDGSRARTGECGYITDSGCRWGRYKLDICTHFLSCVEADRLWNATELFMFLIFLLRQSSLVLSSSPPQIKCAHPKLHFSNSVFAL